MGLALQTSHRGFEGSPACGHLRVDGRDGMVERRSCRSRDYIEALIGQTVAVMTRVPQSANNN